MARPKSSADSRITARRLAADILHQLHPRRQRVSSLLTPRLAQINEPQRCTDLVHGVLRYRAALDTIIRCAGGRSVRSIQKQLLAVLRVAIYELCLCPDTPEHALVNEAVEAAKTQGGRRAGGFVNALLRGIQRHIVSRRAVRVDAESRRILVQDEVYGCLFDLDLWPDPVTHLSEFLVQSYGLPEWLIASWIRAHGQDTAISLCLASNRRPHITLRPNPCRQSSEVIKNSLHDIGINVRLDGEGMIHLDGGGSIVGMPGFQEGWFMAQDITAALAVRLLSPKPDWSVLDLCAAPGGKTTQIAEMMEDRGKVVATDIDTQRLQQVRENAQRLGLSSIQVLSYDDPAIETGAPYDAVLLDVPCSNTGVLAKRVELRYRLRKDGLEKILILQRQLLDRAKTRLKCSGRLAYSTCSIQPEENEAQVALFLQHNPAFSLIAEQRTLPEAGENDRDGGYVAILKLEA